MIDISIILCSYNRHNSLKNTLYKINDITIPKKLKVELIVINNNSTDSTHDFCNDFSKISKLKLSYYLEKKTGLSNARNRGLEIARGKILIFTDDDVEIPDDWLFQYYNTYKKYKADCVFGRIIPQWNSKKPYWYHRSFAPIYGELDYGKDTKTVKERRYEFYGANFSIKREIIEQFGGFDPALGRTPDKLYISEETKLFRYLLNSNYKIIYNPDIFLYHMITDNMKTKAYVKKYYKDTAYSMVMIANISKKRKFLGIPYYRILEFFMFYAKFIPKIIKYFLFKEKNNTFSLILEMKRINRIIYFHSLSYFSKN